MADLINLRQARKRKARADREVEAAANRALHGRSKAQKTRERLEAARSDASLDGHRRQPQDDTDKHQR
jgi:hypothetical protein